MQTRTLLSVFSVVTAGILLTFQSGCGQRRDAEILDDRDKEIKELVARVKVTMRSGSISYDDNVLEALVGHGQRSLPYLRSLIEGESDLSRRMYLFHYVVRVEDVKTLRIFMDYLMGDQNTGKGDMRQVIDWLTHFTGKDFEFDKLEMADTRFAALNDELWRLKDRALVSELDEDDSRRMKQLEAQLLKITSEVTHQIALKYRSWLERELEEGRNPIRSKEEREAEREAERKAIEVGPAMNREAFALFRKGAAYFRLGDLDNALDCYKKSLVIDPESEYLYCVSIGGVYEKKRQWEEAINWYERALAAEPEDAGACWDIGNVYTKKGEWDKGIRYFKMACDRAPKDQRYRYFLGWALARKGEYRQAMEQCEKLKVLDDPETSEYLESLQDAIRKLEGRQ